MSDVVVVGGGLIGLGIAWRTAAGGASVMVVDPAAGKGASWVGAGLLAPVTEVVYGEEPLLELNLASARRYPSFVAELEAASEMDTGYRDHGTVAVAKDADDNAVLEDLFRYQEKLGLPVRRLRSSECRRLEPMLGSVRGGILVEVDRQVDNRHLVEALLEAARRSGVELVADRVVGVRVDGGRVRGVRLESGGDRSAGQVVVAAGPWSSDVPGLPPLPVRPVKGQLVHLRGPSGFLSHNLRGVVRGDHVYVVNRGDGRLVVGATAEEMGFDTTVTAGAVHRLLRDAREILPGLDELELVESIAGLRPGTPDNAPLLGHFGPEGAVAATGHYRNGILLTPITADSVARLLLEGREPPEIVPFSPERFGSVPTWR